jgi:hypothetical protein
MAGFEIGTGLFWKLKQIRGLFGFLNHNAHDLFGRDQVRQSFFASDISPQWARKLHRRNQAITFKSRNPGMISRAKRARSS